VRIVFFLEASTFSSDDVLQINIGAAAAGGGGEGGARGADRGE